MTPRQIELARHALGLPNDQGRSYSNRFWAGPGHTDYRDWEQMVAEGAAAKNHTVPGFHMTKAGAEQALKSGETLDPEDFG